VYGHEIDKLTREILQNVGYLVLEGIIEEERGKKGEMYYRAVDEQRTLE
jgi:hypothetical protein